jgi:hypothetical protein
MVRIDQETHDQFMRIAMARLGKKYCFEPQRLAMAAKMFIKYLERLEERGKSK